MDNLSVAPLVWAMLDCFLVQYKFLYYDEPGFLREGTVPGVGVPGQGWGRMDREEEESLICSHLHHGAAVAKCIKASFRSPVWSVCLSMVVLRGRPTGCADRAGTSSIQQQRISDILMPWMRERKRKGWMDRREAEGGGRGIWGFLSQTWKHICAGGHRPLWGSAVFTMYLQGCMNIWLMSHRLEGNAISS